MTIDEAQQKVLKLVRLATDSPRSEEGRTAAALACRLINEHGLLVMKPSDLVDTSKTDAAPASPSSSPEKKSRRKRPSAKEIRETVTTAADTAATAINAAGRVVAAVNGFRNVIRGS